MSSIKVEFDQAGYRFEIFERKPYGVSDGHRFECVSSDVNETLSALPQEEPYHYVCTEIFWLPARSQWAGFNFTTYQERSVGPNEDDYHGPYLVHEQPPPGPDDLIKAESEKRLVTRNIRLYHRGGELLLSIQQALSQKVPVMEHARHRDAEVISRPCPDCGAPVACVYDDLGPTDFYDNYAHVCLNRQCVYSTYTESRECNIGGRSSPIDQNCPFFGCGRFLALTC